MVTLQSAENALKTIYLGAVTELLNTKSNPLLAKIESTSADIWGKEIKTAAKVGITGGIGAGDEAGTLPSTRPTNYIQFTSTLKNLYGQIEISDKAIRASADGRGSFTDLLNSELEGLLAASKFNLGRMLYGDGTGVVSYVKKTDANDVIHVTNVNNFMEGMVLDAYHYDSDLYQANLFIKKIDRNNGTVVLYNSIGSIISGLENGDYITIQGSHQKEINGIGTVFNLNKPIYGNDRASVPFLNPYDKELNGTLDEVSIQMAIDSIENNSNSVVDYIAVSADVKYAYQEYMAQYKMNIDIMELDGGYKTMSYNGIPFVYDRHIDSGTMYLLDTHDFKMHQLCDWRFLENENGKVLRQKEGKAAYSATLVKYCDLICSRPNGQGRLTKIKRV